MKKSKMISKIALLLVVFILGFVFARQKTPIFVPPLTVMGDVETVLNVSNLKEAGQIRKIRMEFGSFKGVSLKELLAKAKPQETDKIYVVANDGFTAALDADSLEESYITFSMKNGWELINLRHPISSNVKMIQEIIVVAKGSSPLNFFALLSKAKTLSTTVGSLYTQALTSYPYLEGRASLEHEGKSYESEIYTRRRVFKIDDLLPIDENDQIMLLGESGDHLLADHSGFYQLAGNRIDYIQPEEREKLEGVRFAVVDPPAGGIADVYYDARHYLQNGENVLILLVEGLDYSQYENALEDGRAPFFSEKGKAALALGLYPFDANLWLGSMLTGLTPAESVQESENPDSKRETLFDICKATGKKAAMLGVGGEMPCDIDEQVVARDCANGSDDEIHKELISMIPEGYGLMIASFHPLGANSQMTANASNLYADAMKDIDSYMRELASIWPGKIIVTGLPSEKDSQADNLFVPYMLLGTK